MSDVRSVFSEDRVSREDVSKLSRVSKPTGRQPSWCRPTRSWLIWTVASLLLLSGCGSPSSEEANDGGPSQPSWLADLPTTTITVPVGELVWAVVPALGSDAATIATYRLVDAGAGGTALIDTLGNQFGGVIGALVHATSEVPVAELAIGEPILASRWDAGPVIGQVASLDDETVTISHDWNGVTVTGAMDVVTPLASDGEVAPLRWVAYPSPTSEESGASVWLKGLCFAEHDGRLWLRDDSGNVEIVARESVKVLSDLGRLEPAVGDQVSAFAWGSGFRPGVIAEIPEPGLRYTVTFDDGETRPFFFGDLTKVL